MGERSLGSKRSIHFLLSTKERPDTRWNPFVRICSSGLRQEDLQARHIIGAPGLYMVKTDMPVGRDMAVVQMGKQGQWCGDVRQMDSKQYKISIDTDALVHIRWGCKIKIYNLTPGNKLFFFNDAPGRVTVLGEPPELGHWNPHHADIAHNTFRIKEGLSMTVVEMPSGKGPVYFKMVRGQAGLEEPEWERPSFGNKQFDLPGTGEDMAVWSSWGHDEVCATELAASNFWQFQPSADVQPVAITSSMFDISDAKTQSSPELQIDKGKVVISDLERLLQECVHASTNQKLTAEVTTKSLDELVARYTADAMNPLAAGAKLKPYKSVDDYLTEFMATTAQSYNSPKMATPSPTKVCSVDEFVGKESKESKLTESSKDEAKKPDYVPCKEFKRSEYGNIQNFIEKFESKRPQYVPCKEFMKTEYNRCKEYGPHCSLLAPGKESKYQETTSSGIKSHFIEDKPEYLERRARNEELKKKWFLGITDDKNETNPWRPAPGLAKSNQERTIAKPHHERTIAISNQERANAKPHHERATAKSNQERAIVKPTFSELNKRLSELEAAAHIEPKATEPKTYGELNKRLAELEAAYENQPEPKPKQSKKSSKDKASTKDVARASEVKPASPAQAKRLSEGLWATCYDDNRKSPAFHYGMEQEPRKEDTVAPRKQQTLRKRFVKVLKNQFRT